VRALPLPSTWSGRDFSCIAHLISLNMLSLGGRLLLSTRLLIRRSLGRLLRSTPKPVISARALFESRYADELFMADQLMSRGGAVVPEDQEWVDKLLTAYEHTSEVADPGISTPSLPDPWAEDTLPQIFESADGSPALGLPKIVIDSISATSSRSPSRHSSA
jgi:hypothetical protein